MDPFAPGPRFYASRARVRAALQVPRLIEALPESQRDLVWTYPLASGTWKAIRDHFVDTIMNRPIRPLRFWLPGLDALDSVRLQDRDVFPGDAGPLLPRVYHALLEHTLGRGIASTWGDVGRMSVNELHRISGIGSSSVRSIVAYLVDLGVRVEWAGATEAPVDTAPAAVVIEPAVDAAESMGLDTVATPRVPMPTPPEPVPMPPTMPVSPAPEPPPPANPSTPPAPLPPTTEATPVDAAKGALSILGDPLAKVATWAALVHGTARLLDAIELGLSEDAPDVVREAAGILVDARIPPLATSDLGALAERFLEALEEKRREVFEARVLNMRNETLEVVGERLGVTRERIRQIEVAATTKALAMLRTPTYEWIAWSARALRMRLGPAVPDGHAFTDRVFGELFGGAPTAVHRALLWWAAGRYELRDGIWWRGEGRRGSEFEGALYGAMAEDGATPAQLAAVAEREGCPPVFLDAIMASLPNVSMTMGRYFARRLTIPDRCLLAFEELGRPATIEELIAEGEIESDPRSVANRVQADERFARVTKDTYAPRAWGLEEYASVADAISKAIHDSGGIASVPELVAAITAAFGVNATTVRAYCSAPMFVLDGDAVRLRRHEEPYAVPDQLPGRKGVYRFGHVVSVTLDVTRDALRGSGRALPPDVVSALGVQPGTERTFDGGDFTVSVHWPHTGWQGGSVGSLRGAITAVDGQLGQRLRLAFNVEAGTVVSVALDDALLTSLDPLVALRRWTGVAASSAEQAVDALDEALRRPLAGVVATLRARGDDDVAGLVQVLDRDA